MPGTKDGQDVLIVVVDEDAIELSAEMWTDWFASFGMTLIATGDAYKIDTIPNTPQRVIKISCERY